MVFNFIKLIVLDVNIYKNEKPQRDLCVCVFVCCVHVCACVFVRACVLACLVFCFDGLELCLCGFKWRVVRLMNEKEDRKQWHRYLFRF